MYDFLLNLFGFVFVLIGILIGLVAVLGFIGIMFLLVTYVIEQFKNIRKGND